MLLVCVGVAQLQCEADRRIIAGIPLGLSYERQRTATNDDELGYSPKLQTAANGAGRRRTASDNVLTEFVAMNQNDEPFVLLVHFAKKNQTIVFGFE